MHAVIHASLRKEHRLLKQDTRQAQNGQKRNTPRCSRPWYMCLRAPQMLRSRASSSTWRAVMQSCMKPCNPAAVQTSELEESFPALSKKVHVEKKTDNPHCKGHEPLQQVALYIKRILVRSPCPRIPGIQKTKWNNHSTHTS
mmetsp:Transcript_113027/g.225063  ORF Transcript_113027/g.225063 Transcript_113027/m.225063 type:complete len:142 (-) Transcript_113027:1172-1597(-)